MSVEGVEEATKVSAIITFCTDGTVYRGGESAGQSIARKFASGQLVITTHMRPVHVNTPRHPSPVDRGPGNPTIADIKIDLTLLVNRIPDLIV
jgi:hypothetical protein